MNYLPDINHLLAYTNVHIINRYQKDYPNNKLSAEEALREICKYFWLIKKHKQDRLNNPDDENLNFICSVHAEMKEIDDMWHTFLLFTKEYHEFCKRYFNEFIHHVPNVDENNNQTPEQFENEFTRYLSYVYDHLGEETIKTWFAEHA